jgi:hypothetical protein
VNDESQILDLTPIRTRGRSQARLEVEVVRPLTSQDAASTQDSRGSKAPALKRFRDSHHRVARCFASGMKPQEVNLQTGYSFSRLSILQADPAFQNLVEVYREAGVEEYAEYQDLALANMVRAERLIEESLEAVADREQPLALGELRPLTELISDRADRFGFPKKTVQTNVNLEFAGRLESARKRSGLLELKAQSEGEGLAPSPKEAITK